MSTTGLHFTRQLKPLADRLWSHVDRSGGPDACWPWMAYRDHHGYGQIGLSFPRRLAYAHRIAWELTNGPIPAGEFICHHCDNPPCCNPSHLFPGTQADNMRDAKCKGRIARGERNYNAVLTDGQVRSIRALYGTMLQCEIAHRFGVSEMTVSWIVRRITWKHVQ